jgi:thymidylate kinase
MKKSVDVRRSHGAWKGATSGDAAENHIDGAPSESVPGNIQKLLQLRRLRHQRGQFSDGIELNARVLIIEGVSGSGKDGFQAYLKNKLKGRDVYDYSEGELLHSWKHFSIKGILKFRVGFEKLFVKYIKEVITRDANAVFLLNRFHLSTYASIVVRQPELAREYDSILKILRTLPVHVFILQLDENEIEERSLHSERSNVWRMLQQQLAANDGFENKLEKYIAQQRLLIATAKKQQIPYSVIKFPFAPATARRVVVESVQAEAKSSSPIFTKM